MNKLLNISILATSILALSCSGEKTGDKKSTQANTNKAEMVKVAPLEIKQVARSVEYPATLQAFEELHMAPASPGRIDAINVEVGSRVKKGDLIVQMDRTQLHQAEIQLKNLEIDFKRFDTLQKVGSVPQQQYDQMKSQLEISRSNVAFLKENTQLRAPFSGVISGKYFEAGEMYSGTPVAQVGKAAIVSLVQIDNLKAIVPVSEMYFPLISKGMETSIISDIYPDKTFKGRVFNIYPTIDAASRTFNVEIQVENREGLLRPGMFNRITLNLEQVEAMLLPAIAVLKMQGSNDRYLFIEKDGIAHRIPVTLGNRYNELVEVFAQQLQKGDRIVVSGQARLLDGMKVKVEGE
ncbi:MAG: efflux RND transporter periplasmic adaptor subunit [Lentimicrobium sp.]|jgi:RND family efflux transporter MFP subunit|nr:efflux RND transporter periplasmic adaptor subunit [Lentimicrobium sp.]